MIEFLKAIQDTLQAEMGAGELLVDIQAVDLFRIQGETFPRIVVAPAQSIANQPVGTAYELTQELATVAVYAMLGDGRVEVAATSAMALMVKIKRTLLANRRLITSDYAGGLLQIQNTLNLGRMEYGETTTPDEGQTGTGVYYAVIEVSGKVIYHDGVAS